MLYLNPQFHHYFIRINEYPGYAELINGLAESTRFPLFLVIKHDGSTKENPHFHLVLSTIQKVATLRAYLKTIFKEGRGNAHMSIKKWDGNERAIQYLYHEQDCAVVHSKGFTPEFLTEQRTKAKLFTATKSKYTTNLYDCVIEQIYQNDDNLGDLINEHKWDHRRICMLIWDCCKSQDKSYPNKFLLESLIRKVQATLSQKGLKNLPNWKDQKLSWYCEMFPQN